MFLAAGSEPRGSGLRVVLDPLVNLITGVASKRGGVEEGH